MNAEKLIEHCFENGVFLFVENGNLKARGNENQIQALASTLKERKDDLVQYLEAANERPSEPYREKPLIGYFISEGWSYEAAIKLAREMIERDSYLAPHEHLKYMECEKQEKAQ